MPQNYPEPTLELKPVSDSNATPPQEQFNAFEGVDYFCTDELLKEEHLQLRAKVRSWVDRRVVPVIEEYTESETCPTHLYTELGELGALGANLPTEYGCGGLDEISYGIISQELERGDSAIRSMASVQSSLVMYPIYRFGSEEQKRLFLPRMAKGELIGCFGLTEPNFGSNPSGMLSNIREDGDCYVLNGSKIWITNGSIADVALVWAKDETGKIRGVIVEKGMEGYSTSKITGKWSFRASITGELVFSDVRVPKKNVLPNVKGMKGPLTCLSKARLGIAWGSIGIAMDCYQAALQFSKERTLNGKLLGGHQLTQQRLAEMITEITQAQLLALRLADLANEGKASSAQISMAKRNNVQMALQTARNARLILGEAGVTGKYPIMRHLMNLEAVVTYEGTHDIHLLITGMDVTGINAFK